MNILTKYLIVFILVLLCMECAPAPRYRSGSNPFPSKQTDEEAKKGKQKSKKDKKISYNPNKTTYMGISSFYGPKFHGKLTANGEVFDMYGVTAAHKEFPFNTVARVTNEKNGKSLILRINDRGPYIDGRILDCSFGAAKKLDFVSDGTATVKIEIMEWGDGEYMHHD